MKKKEATANFLTPNVLKHTDYEKNKIKYTTVKF